MTSPRERDVYYYNQSANPTNILNAVNQADIYQREQFQCQCQ